MLMTTTTSQVEALPIRRLMRAKLLVPPAERRAIRKSGRLHQEDIAREIRARGISVTAGAVALWEKEKSEGGFDPRPQTAIVYSRILDEIKAEVAAIKAELAAQGIDCDQAQK